MNISVLHMHISGHLPNTDRRTLNHDDDNRQNTKTDYKQGEALHGEIVLLW